MTRSSPGCGSRKVVEVEIANEQSVLLVDEDRLRRAVRIALDETPVRRAAISLAVVDDPTIHRLNRRYLDHDYPTDVLSFVLDRTADSLDGEVIVSSDTAVASAAQFGWSADDELLLYVIHGVLHLAGYDDILPEQRGKMRNRERACLARFGLEHRFDDSAEDDGRPPVGGPGGETQS
ncbi:MAG: rRNA maturation RNase YbeY [Pirellulales bacterium]|nr:rRNA maturation RNase YbeY [Pirellulales bacterium]